MLIRAYLRASTVEQDALRAKDALTRFTKEKGHRIASFYIEQASGATLARPELMRLIDEAHEGDILLIEQVDRLARLKAADWEHLKRLLSEKGLMVVSLDVPTTWAVLDGDAAADGVTAALQKALSNMLLDVLAAVARKDYEDRRRRQKEGIAKAKAAGAYKGKAPDLKRRGAVARMLKGGASYTEIQRALDCSRTFIASVARELKSA